ncbi:50S ribosomal protein L29 [Candidatus Curtissbacteria bacterium]|nr:50S ribosomal protein L29 [Candidatus Curtissbacteria bacterium]
MKKKDLNEIKTKSADQLKKNLADLKKEIASLRIDIGMGKGKNVHEMRAKRLSLAQISTVMNQKLALEKLDQAKTKNKEEK